VYGALLLIWIVMPTFIITFGSVLVTDIINGTCVPWGVYNSYVAEKAITSLLLLVTYLLPLILTVSCYCRIVCSLLSR